MPSVEELLNRERAKVRGTADAPPSSRPTNRTAGVLMRARRNVRLEKDIRKLERDLGMEQEGNVLQRAGRAVLGNPFVKTVLDVVSRVNYSQAGVFDELARTPGSITGLQPGGITGPGALAAAGRVGREIFSGVGDIQGEKKAFGETFEDLGFGTGGSLSRVIPGAFSATGKGAKFQRDGFFDWTARGSLGLALDIFADPTTYITFGTAATGRQSVRAGANFLTKKGVARLKTRFEQGVRRGLTQKEADKAARAVVAQEIERGATHLADQGGIKLFGETLVPSEFFARPAADAKSAVVKTLQQTTLGQKVLNVGEGVVEEVGAVLNRDFLVRKNPEYIARKQLMLTTIVARQRELFDRIDNLFRNTDKVDREAVTLFVDTGGKTPLDPNLLRYVKQSKSMTDDWAVIEQELELLDNVRLDYVFHAYDGDPRTVQTILKRFDPDNLKANLRGSNKPRTFATIPEAEAALAAKGVKPIKDSAELLRRRGIRHIHAVEHKRFFDDVIDKWGVKALPDEMEAGATRLASEMNAIGKAVNADALTAGASIKGVRKLSEDGRREFLKQRFERVQNPWELEEVGEKYKEFGDLFPETTNQQTRRLKSYQGEPMVELKGIKEFAGMRVPRDIAQDITDFNKTFIDRESIRTLLRGYDKVANTFKVGVTAIFPAFHFRNAYSNIAQQFTDLGISALNPKMHADAVRMLAGDVSGSFVSKIGRRWGYSEVVYEAKRRGAIADYRNIFETFGDKIPVRTGGRKVKDFVRHPIDSMKRFGGVIENEARLSAFVNYLRRGVDPETAAQRVNKVHFDYTNLSVIERDVLTRIFPFYRWTRKNIALQAERLARNPGQAGIQAKLTQHEGTDPADLPKYLRGEFVFTLDSDPRTGKFTTIRGLDLPINDLNVLSDPLGRLTGDVLPLAKLPAELAMDRDFFQKRTISENSQPLLWGVGQALDLLPGAVKKKIDFNKKTLRDGTVEYRMNPTLTYVVIKSWALSRVYGTASRLMENKSNSAGAQLLDLGTGFRLQDVDVDVAADNLEREYQEILRRKKIAEGDGFRFDIVGTRKPKR